MFRKLIITEALSNYGRFLQSESALQISYEAPLLLILNQRYWQQYNISFRIKIMNVSDYDIV